MKNIATAGWLLVGLGALSCASSGLGSGFWIACSVSIWLLPVFYSTDLQQPRGFGAWGFWALWCAVSAVMGLEPMVSAQASLRGATEVLIFILAYSWWGRPHRRIFLAGLWLTAALLGIHSAWTKNYDPVGCGFLVAALGSCLAAQAGELSALGSWRVLLRILPALYGALTVLALASAQIRERLSISAQLPAWREAFAILGDWPVRGVGPGLYRLGVLRSQDFSNGLPISRGEWALEAGETGLIGIALMLAAFLYSAPGLTLTASKAPREWERQAAAGAFWGLAIFSLVEGTLTRPALGSLWFATLACAAPGNEELESRTLRLPKVIGVAAAMACLLCSLPSYYPAWAELSAPKDPQVHLAAAARELARHPPELGRALMEIERAIEADPFNSKAVNLKAAIIGAHAR